MKSGTIIMIIELVIIIILSIFLIKANSKISKYEKIIPNIEEQKEQNESIEENGEETESKNNPKQQEVQQKNEETVKTLPGTDSKSGLNIQNVEIETKNKTSKLKAEVINNLGEEIGEVNFNICLTDENNNIINKYPQKINGIKAGEIKKIEITVNNVEKVQGYYVE